MGRSETPCWTLILGAAEEQKEHRGIRHSMFRIATVVLAFSSLGTGQDLLITEVHYHPSAAQGEAEFVEVYNPHPLRIDISLFFFDRGIDFIFGDDTWIEPHEAVLVAKSPEEVRRTLGVPADVTVFGPFGGALENRGETISVSNSAGRVISSVRYNDRGRWPVSPAGAGHTLELHDPRLDLRRVESWTASSRVGGTPGRGFEIAVPTKGGDPDVLIETGALWRFLPGDGPVPSEWTQAELLDSLWESGPSGFGYGDDDDATILDDMRGAYLSVYLRRRFAVDRLESVEGLTLRVDYDDGFVAYLNGVEVARAGLGAAGAEVTPDTAASPPHEAGTAEEFDISGALDLLRPENNVLAIEGHNASLGSSDFSLLPELVAALDDEPPAGDDDAIPGLRVVGARFGVEAAEGERWIELENGGELPVALDSVRLSNDPDDLGAVAFPDGEVLASGERRVVDEASLPFSLAVDHVRLFLSSADLSRVLDAADLAAPANVEGEWSLARFPADDVLQRDVFQDGASGVEGEWIVVLDSTPGAPRRRPPRPSLAINEIHYHGIARRADEIDSDAREEFIEIHNFGDAAIDLGGTRFREGIAYDFEDGASIEPGGYLVVARDPASLEAQHGIQDVLGPWTGILRDSGELVVLSDALGNVIDRVRYFDGGAWPRSADSGGSSLERIDPRQATDAATAWAASIESPAARWTRFTYEGVHRDGEPEIHLLLMARGSCLVDDISVRSGATEHVPNGGFEAGVSPWIIDGNHIHSHVTRDDSHGGTRSLRIVATGRGDPGANHIEVETSPPIQPGQTYTVSFRARWERGSPLLMTRSYGQGLARVSRLEVPAKSGTPGAPNSTRRDDLGPAFDRLRQSPARPAPGTAVRFTVRIRDADGVSSATLRFRPEGEATFRSVSLADDGAQEDGETGDDIFGAEVPPFANLTIVELCLEAVDGVGNSSRFPDVPSVDDPDRQLFTYQVDGGSGDVRLPSVRLVITEAVREELETRTQTSNHLLPITVVVDDDLIRHRAWLRQRGCFCSRGLIHPPIWRLKVGDDHPLGGRTELNLDNQHADPTNLRDRITYWLMRKLGGIPYPNSRYIRVYRNGRFDKIYEDVDKPDADFLAESFDGGGGSLFKVDGWFEFPDAGARYTWRPGDLRYRGEGAEEYRWRYKNRSREELDDFAPMIDLVRLLDPAATPDDEFDRDANGRLATTSWLRSVAVRVLVDAWDTVGVFGGKNAFLYQDAGSRKWHMLPFDNDATFGNDRETPLLTKRDAAIRRFASRPAFVRRYFRTFRELLDGPFRRETLDPILDEAHALLRSEAATSPPTAIKSFISQRRAFVDAELGDDVPLRFLTNGGNPAITDQTSFTLLGEAPLAAAVFLLDEDVVEPTFFSLSRFRLDVELRPGVNDLTLVGLDELLREVGRDSIRITSTAEPEEPVFTRGNVNGDASVDLSDAVAILEHLFRGGSIDCRDAADTDDNGAVEITDAIRLLNHLFLGGPPPAPPYPDEALDPTEDALDCDA